MSRVRKGGHLESYTGFNIVLGQRRKHGSPMEGDDFLQQPGLGVSSLDAQLRDVPLGGDEVLVGVTGVVNGASVIIALVVGMLVGEDDFPRRRGELISPAHGFCENHIVGFGGRDRLILGVSDIFVLYANWI